MKQRNLFERICRRGAISHTVTDHVRAELQRVARQIKKLCRTQGQFYGDATCVRLKDVLDLIREARR